jgi:hypothetical protein
MISDTYRQGQHRGLHRREQIDDTAARCSGIKHVPTSL